MKPFFSVIIPAFDAAETLCDTLRSVEAQTFGNYEVILINDGSRDESGQIMAAFREAHPGERIQIVEQKNKGLGYSRNQGAQAAQGDWLAWLDADDLWHPQKLANCAEFLQASPEGEWLYHPFIAFSENERRQRKAYPLKKLSELLSKGNPLTPSASLVKRELALAFPFSENPDFHGAEDLHLWIRLLAAGHQPLFWPEALTEYRLEGGMSSRLEEHLQKTLNVLQHFYREGYYLQSDLEKARRRKYYEAGRHFHKHNNHALANRYYSAADAKSVKLLGMRFLNLLGIKW